MLDARFSHLYFYQRLHTLQLDLSEIAELLVHLSGNGSNWQVLHWCYCRLHAGNSETSNVSEIYIDECFLLTCPTNRLWIHFVSEFREW